MPLTITYRLSGTGWAECSLSDGKSSCDLTASYLSDALYNLVLAATAALSGFMRVSFRFDEEPGEYRWVISSPRLNEIELEILSFTELWGDRPDTEGESLFKTRCLPETFAKAVAAAAQSILEEHGEAGYKERWSEHPFPSAQLEELTRLLKEQERDG
ncbi:MAG TPA: hypothetical protein PLW86_04905 [Rhodocyclaceae bacterium]|nr:hypothetical protein [Rhodocyclaceae bacterium]